MEQFVLNVNLSEDIGNILTEGNISPNTPSEGCINDILWRKFL